MRQEQQKQAILQACLGIDVSKAELAVCLAQRDSAQQITVKGTRKFPNTPAGLQALQAWVSARRPAGDVPLSVVLEATGVYYELAAYSWRDQGVPVHVVLPAQAKHFARSLNVKTKTDAIDAVLLARLGLERRLKPWQGLTPTMLAIKQLCRERSRLIEQRTSLLNQQEALRHSYTPRAATLERVQQHLDFLEEQLQVLTDELEALVAADALLRERVERLTSLPGVGRQTALTILAETNAFELFTHKAQVVSYAGLDVVERQSGTSVHGRPRISKRGNAHIRRALYFPALTAVRAEGPFKTFYQRLCQRNPQAKLIAVVAVQRKLLTLLYTLYKKNEAYDPTFESKQAAKKSRQDESSCLHSIASQEELAS